LSEPIAAPLFTGDSHGPAYAVSFFSTPDYLGLIELFSSLYVSPLCCLDIPQFSSSHRLLLSDPTIRVYLCATRLSHNPHVHTIISPTILPPLKSVYPFLILAGLLRHSVHIQKTPRVPLSHAQVVRYPSFSLAPTIFIHPDSKSEQCGSLWDKFLPFLVVF
jgi:hypothetical protein